MIAIIQPGFPREIISIPNSSYNLMSQLTSGGCSSVLTKPRAHEHCFGRPGDSAGYCPASCGPHPAVLRVCLANVWWTGSLMENTDGSRSQNPLLNKKVRDKMWPDSHFRNQGHCYDCVVSPFFILVCLRQAVWYCVLFSASNSSPCPLGSVSNSR